MKKLLFAALLATAGPAFGQGMPAPEGAQVYFIGIENGSSVTSPLTVRFGLSGMGVAPAGTDLEMTGHHHLLVNRAALGEGPDAEEEFLYPLPADDNHRHFGGGQTEVTLDLPPGEHTLQLVLGDMNHVPHDPPIVSDVITVTVQ